ncbi:Hypothetical_protein [Hexamita inflata]|uniref:Hypothetical_protein n=1 Tax=Hexamita inflata TaxID=28002 RepID=A0AA86R8D5_9EUKA|nr:Hypothetical protein HINF_LOCUS60921 [Hexamita inflata]
MYLAELPQNCNIIHVVQNHLKFSNNFANSESLQLCIMCGLANIQLQRKIEGKSVTISAQNCIEDKNGVQQIVIPEFRSFEGSSIPEQWVSYTDADQLAQSALTDKQSLVLFNKLEGNTQLTRMLKIIESEDKLEDLTINDITDKFIVNMSSKLLSADQEVQILNNQILNQQKQFKEEIKLLKNENQQLKNQLKSNTIKQTKSTSPQTNQSTQIQNKGLEDAQKKVQTAENSVKELENEVQKLNALNNSQKQVIAKYAETEEAQTLKIKELTSLYEIKVGEINNLNGEIQKEARKMHQELLAKQMIIDEENRDLRDKLDKSDHQIDLFQLKQQETLEKYRIQVESNTKQQVIIQKLEQDINGLLKELKNKEITNTKQNDDFNIKNQMLNNQIKEMQLVIETQNSEITNMKQQKMQKDQEHDNVITNLNATQKLAILEKEKQIIEIKQDSFEVRKLYENELKQGYQLKLKVQEHIQVIADLNKIISSSRNHTLGEMEKHILSLRRSESQQYEKLKNLQQQLLDQEKYSKGEQLKADLNAEKLQIQLSQAECDTQQVKSALQRVQAQNQELQKQYSDLLNTSKQTEQLNQQLKADYKSYENNLSLKQAEIAKCQLHCNQLEQQQQLVVQQLETEIQTLQSELQHLKSINNFASKEETVSAIEQLKTAFNAKLQSYKDQIADLERKTDLYKSGYKKKKQLCAVLEEKLEQTKSNQQPNQNDSQKTCSAINQNELIMQLIKDKENALMQIFQLQKELEDKKEIIPKINIKNKRTKE